MNELRSDPLTGRTVLFASSRAGRPNDYDPRRGPAAAPTAEGCPFCEGQEGQTPPALAERLGADGRWRQRVVPNKYPVCGRRDEDACEGSHEVIIESPRHLSTTTELGADELAGVISVYAERLSHWRLDGRFPCRIAFKNVAASAGASLAHLHSQVLALPALSVQQEVEAALIAQQARPAEAWRAWRERELADSRRIIDRSSGLIAFCPSVSRAPGEFWVMPAVETPFFEDSHQTEEACQELASVLFPLLARLEERILPAGYNVIVHTAPTSGVLQDAFCWRVEIVPRVASLAGFELGTGMFINTLPPDEAAAMLRG